MKLNKKTATLFVARTAILLAIALLAQFVLLKLVPAGIFNTIFVGTVINMVLFVAVATTSIWSGIIIGLLTPVMAFLQGKLAFWLLIPIVGLASTILCIAFFLCIKFLPKTKSFNYIIGIVVASLIKFLFMYICVQTFIPAMLTTFSGFPAKQVGKIVATLSVMWSYPQLVAALLGGFLSLPIKNSLKKVI